MFLSVSVLILFSFYSHKNENRLRTDQERKKDGGIMELWNNVEKIIKF